MNYKKELSVLIPVAALVGLCLQSNELAACHAVALVNPQQNYVTGGIELTASSDSPTCGCSEYWMDIEIRCTAETYDSAAFSANFWGPLDNYPYYQSGQMIKPSCVVQQYPWTFVDFSLLGPGVTYKYRMRENHNGDVGPWSADEYFTVPGTAAPLNVAANASSTVICQGDSLTLYGSGAASYVWSNGVINGVPFTPTSSDIYTVTGTDCDGQSATASITITVNSSFIQSDTLSICQGDSVYAAGAYQTTSGTYYDSLTTINSCDSVIMVNLTVSSDTIDVSVSVSGNVLTAGSSVAAYQWIDCNNTTPLSGNTTGQSYEATANGSYAVVLTQNNCSEESDCYTITNVGLTKYNTNPRFQVFPNPASNVLNIVANDSNGNVNVQLYNIIGTKVLENNFTGNNMELDINHLPAGTYLLNIVNEEKRAVVRIIK